MKKTILAAALALASLGFAAQASAAVIDFEALAHDADVAYVGYSYAEDGFLLSNLNTSGFDFSTWGSTSDFYTGSTALANDNDGGLTQLSQIGGGLFSLSSISLAALYPSITEDSVEVSFTGLLGNGSTVSQTFMVAAGMPQVFNFDSSFTNLASVSWANNAMYHQFDDINVVAVPEPESYAMLLAGLGLIGALARRRNRV